MFDIKFTTIRGEGNPVLYGEISRFLVACLEERKQTESERNGEILEALNELAYAAPRYDLGHYWSHAQLAAALAVCKNTGHIWSGVPAAIKERLDFIMEMFVYLGAYATQRNNNYNTGFAWRGDFSKKWNPNFQLSVFPLMVYTTWYFEGALAPEQLDKCTAIDNLLLNFNFDQVMERARVYGFNQLVECWNTTPCVMPDGSSAPTAKELLENGGNAYISDSEGNIMYAGTGETIKQKYMFRKGGLWHLPRIQLEECYSGGLCTSRVDVDGDGTFDGYTLGNKENPAEGCDGMILEFNSVGGTTTKLRSSLFYSSIDFELATALVAVTIESGWWGGLRNDPLYEKIKAGNADVIFKAENGYHDVANGRRVEITAEKFAERRPSFALWAEYWNKYLA